MRYTIRQMAKLLGTTTHKLRFYQKMGIIRPEIEESTGYRFYSVLDTRRFNLACKYCNLGFSIQESLGLISFSKEEDIIESLAKKEKELLNKIIFDKLCIKHIKEIEFYLKNIDCSLNRVIEIDREEMIRIEFSNEEIINEESNILKLRNDLLIFSPLIEWTSRIQNDVLLDNNKPLKYYYGINLKLSYALKLGIDIKKYEIIPAGKYLYTTFIKKNRKPFEHETLKSIQNYLKNNNINLKSDGFSSCFHSTLENGDYTNYHYIMVKL